MMIQIAIFELIRVSSIITCVNQIIEKLFANFFAAVAD
jgi:hypothetical protein